MNYRGPEGHKTLSAVSTKDGRLTGEWIRKNTDLPLNFVPKMGRQKLLEGYCYALSHVYSPRNFYERLVAFLRIYNPHKKSGFSLKLCYIKALLRSIWVLGINEEERFY